MTEPQRPAPTNDPAGENPDPPHDAVNPARLLAAPDYMTASAKFLRLVVDARMTKIEPAYGAMRRVRMPEGVSGISVQVDDVETGSPTVVMSHQIEVQRDDVRTGNLDAYHQLVDGIADAHLNSLMTDFYRHVGDAAAAVGNEVTIDGPLTWDVCLAIIERMPWTVDTSGQLQQPQIVLNPKDSAALRANPPTTSQQQRLQNIAQTKMEEHVSRRRGRRLRRKPD